MDYDNLLTKWFEGEVSEAENDFIFSTFIEKLRAGKELSKLEVEYLWNWGSITDSRVIDSYKHGYNFVEFIIEPMPNEFYSLTAINHDDYDMEYDAQVCPRVEKRQVMVERWVPVDENRT